MNLTEREIFEVWYRHSLRDGDFLTQPFNPEHPLLHYAITEKECAWNCWQLLRKKAQA